MSESAGIETGRLNGWKEIAGYLGKGPRTVQRWEKLYGLPVHRIGREGGEIVFAFRAEVDRWMATGAHPRAAGENGSLEALLDDPRPRPASPRAVRRWLVPALLLACAAGALAVVSRPRPAANAGDASRPAPEALRRPAAWRMADESLVVFDARGVPLFEHPFGSLLASPVSSETPVPPFDQAPVVIVDVDGDGRSEVLARPNTLDRSRRTLHCLESDGRVRFVHQPTGTRRFGDDEYGEPWWAHRVFATRGPDGTRRLWAVFTHNLMFPSVLQELDPRDGSVRQEYWSNGFIHSVREDVWAGRPVVLVGAGNNDFRGASLAVFPPEGVTGSTPAARPGYACRDCTPGHPEELFVFPSLCIARRGGQAGAPEVWVEKGDRLRVLVSQGDATLGTAYVYYMLGPDGALVSVEISPELQAQHAALERQGALDHPFGARDARDALPVKRWDGRRFVDLPRVPVEH